jgi:hypothetical protein
MIEFAIVLFCSVFLSLFVLFVLSENDFILVRREITLPIMFNRMFLSMIAAFMIGRAVYALDTGEFYMFNPLVFFNFAKFQGFSVFGAFFGAVGAMLYLTRDRKALGRTLDIFSLSYFPYLLLYFLKNPISFQMILIKIVILIVLVVIFSTFLNSHRNYSLKDGSLFFVVLITFAHFNILQNIYNFNSPIFLRFPLSDLVALFSILIGVLLLIKNEHKFLLRR